MAEQDSNEPQNKPNPLLKNPLAPVSDRFLAYALDLCLWMPLAILPARPLWRKFQYHYLMEPNSVETMIGLMGALVIAVAFFMILQTLFVWKWGATPGKQILRLKIVSLDGAENISLGSAFLRTCTQMFELFLLGIPYLEVLSHVKRRPWHDRIAETQVVTLKQIKSESPHWLEVRFFRNIYWGLVGCCALMMWGFGGGLLSKADRGAFKLSELETAGYLCEFDKNIPVHEGLSEEEGRMDYALSLYRSDRLSRECLENEADFAFWTNSGKLMPWAHLIRGVLAQEDHKDLKESEEQFLFACPIGNSGAVCQLTKWFNISKGLEEAKNSSWSGKSEYMRSLVSEGRFLDLKSYLENETWPESLAPALQDSTLRLRMVLGQREEFRALFSALNLSWADDERNEIAAWSCWAETVAKDCGTQKLPKSCELLKKNLVKKEMANLSAPALMSLKFDASCSNRQDARLDSQVENLIRLDSKFDWIRSLGEKGPKALDRLVLAAGKLSKDHWAASYLLGDAVMAAKTSQDFEKVKELFTKFSSDNYSWWVAFKSFERKAPDLFQPKIERRISSEEPKAAGGDQQ